MLTATCIGPAKRGRGSGGRGPIADGLIRLTILVEDFAVSPFFPDAFALSLKSSLRMFFSPLNRFNIVLKQAQ
jgi:hypothetical protein